VAQDKWADASNAITEKLLRLERKVQTAQFAGAASLVMV
jgi:hypothetical protein